jgi:polar amino acid transport system permease protein
MLTAGTVATGDARAPADAAELGSISHLTHVPRRYWGRYAATALIVIALLFVANAFARGKIEWSYVAKFLTAQSILTGLVNTVVMSILAMALGIVLGVVTAVMRLSTNPVLSWVARGYTWLFRGTPVILQLLLWFNLALVFPTIGVHGVWEMRTVDLMTPFLAALLGLGINQGAYTSEVVRAGLLSVDVGQYEAAKAVGMPRLLALRRIILPQAMRVIIPPIGNEFVGMIKLTSLASVIQYAEMLHNAQNIYYANARVIELLIVAGIWYVVVVTVLSLLQSRVEAFYARGAGRMAARQ